MQPQASVPDRARRNDALHTGLIVLVALASHGLLLISDGRVGDDWLYLHWMENHKWEAYKRFHHLYNNFYQAAPLWPLSYFPNVAAALHVLSFAVIALSGIVVYRIGRVARYFSSTECFLIAALSVCYPAFMWHASSIYSVFYNLPVLVFLVATYVALVSEWHTGTRRYGLQIISLIAYLYSFHAGSLLMFFYGAAIVHGYVLASINRLDWKQAVVYYCTRRVHFLLCPVAFRAAYQIFSHPYITNEIRTDIETYTRGLLQFARTILSQAGELVAHNVFWIVAIGGAVVVGVARLRARGATTPVAGAGYRWRDLYGPLSFGVVLLLLGIFAYIATGKMPYEGVTTGYSTRTLLLAQVPVAVILVSLLRSVSIGALTRPLVYPVAAALIASSTALQAREHLKWLHLAVLDRSFEMHLSSTPGARDITYFIVVDRAFYMGYVHHPLASLPFQVADVFRGKSHVFGDLPPAFEISNARVPQKSLDSLIAEYTVSGGRSLVDEWQLVLPTEYRQGVLIVCRGPEFHYRSPVRMAASYQFYRWFKPERLPRFLTPLLQLKLVTPDSTKSASDDVLGADPCEAINRSSAENQEAARIALAFAS